MNTLILIAFILGYTFIALESSVQINKAAVALFTGVVCWTLYILGASQPEPVVHQLVEHIGDISQIIFFLIGAMTIVELIDSYHGFDVISKQIRTNNKKVLLVIISFIAFFLSSVLDNLTTTIVMITLTRKLLEEKKDKWLFSSMIVISANSGGAWTPIGDVTTTMLWIGGRISTVNIMHEIFLPSLVSMVIPMLIVSIMVKGKFEKIILSEESLNVTNTEKNIVFFMGIGALIFVPVFKTFTHLPPFMGMLVGLSVLWITTEYMHRKKEHDKKVTVSLALRKIDIPSILFFLGILLAVASLEATGLLGSLANTLNEKVGDLKYIAMSLGLLSSVIDNVPLVAASMGMYDLHTFPMDHYFWELMAYAAGTGGSILIIGSAAGVAAMGLEKIDFLWYLKKISLLALAGYFAGALLYIFMMI